MQTPATAAQLSGHLPDLCQLCWGQGEVEAGLRLPALGAHEQCPPLPSTGLAMYPGQS